MLTRSFDTSLETLANHLDFRVTHACYACFPQDEMYQNSYPHNRLFLVKKTTSHGGGRIEYRRSGESWQELTIHKKCAILMPEGMELRFHFAQGLSLYAIHFNLGIIRGLDLFHDLETCISRPYTDDKTLDRLIELANDSPYGLSGMVWAKATLLGIVADFLQGDLAARTQDMRIYDKYRSMFDFLEDKLSLTLTVDQLAQASGMQAATLSRNFRTDTGSTLKSEITRRVLRESQRCLAETDMPIKQVAAQLGFTSEPYFSRFIRKHLGQTPGGYRAEIRKNFA